MIRGGDGKLKGKRSRRWDKAQQNQWHAHDRRLMRYSLTAFDRALRQSDFMVNIFAGLFK